MCGGENNRTTKLSLKFVPNDIPTEAIIWYTANVYRQTTDN